MPAERPDDRRRLRAVVTEASLRHFFNLALQGNREQALALVLDKVELGVSPVGVLNAMLIPALQEVGELWQANLLSQDQEAVVSGVCQYVLDQCLNRMHEGTERLGDIGSIVVAAAPGECHTLAASLAKIVLASGGWTVTDLGGDVSPGDLSVTLSEADDRCGLLLHTSRSSLLPGAYRAIVAATEAGIGVVVAGAGFGPRGLYGFKLGAVGWAADCGPNLNGLFPAGVPASIDVARTGLDFDNASLVATATVELADSFSEPRHGAPEVAVGELEPARFMLGELEASVLLREPSILQRAAHWYRDLLASRDVSTEILVQALDELRDRLSDCGPCEAHLSAAIDSLA